MRTATTGIGKSEQAPFQSQKKESDRFLPGENTKEASIRDLSKTEGQTKQKIRNPAPVPGTV